MCSTYSALYFLSIRESLLDLKLQIGMMLVFWTSSSSSIYCIYCSAPSTLVFVTAVLRSALWDVGAKLILFLTASILIGDSLLMIFGLAIVFFFATPVMLKYYKLQDFILNTLQELIHLHLRDYC